MTVLTEENSSTENEVETKIFIGQNMAKEMGTSEKLTDMESPSCSQSPPSCIINIAGLTKSYEHFIKEDGLLDDPQGAHKDKEKHL